MLLFIFFRANFGVEKPVFVSEKQKQKMFDKQDKYTAKCISIQFNSTAIVHFNQSAVMTITKRVFSLQ